MRNFDGRSMLLAVLVLVVSILFVYFVQDITYKNQSKRYYRDPVYTDYREYFDRAVARLDSMINADYLPAVEVIALNPIVGFDGDDAMKLDEVGVTIDADTLINPEKIEVEPVDSVFVCPAVVPFVPERKVIIGSPIGGIFFIPERRQASNPRDSVVVAKAQKISSSETYVSATVQGVGGTLYDYYDSEEKAFVKLGSIKKFEDMKDVDLLDVDVYGGGFLGLHVSLLSQNEYRSTKMWKYYEAGFSLGRDLKFTAKTNFTGCMFDGSGTAYNNCGNGISKNAKELGYTDVCGGDISLTHFSFYEGGLAYIKLGYEYSPYRIRGVYNDKLESVRKFDAQADRVGPYASLRFRLPREIDFDVWWSFAPMKKFEVLPGDALSRQQFYVGIKYVYNEWDWCAVKGMLELYGYVTQNKKYAREEHGFFTVGLEFVFYPD